LDCTKARARLGWQPAWHLDEALEKILSWHKAYADGKNMRAICMEQIAAYQSIAIQQEKVVA
jgi:CDP-glucose 4,6-dehydratase